MDKPSTPPTSAYMPGMSPEPECLDIEHLVDCGNEEFDDVETDADDVVQEEVRTDFTRTLAFREVKGQTRRGQDKGSLPCRRIFMGTEVRYRTLQGCALVNM